MRNLETLLRQQRLRPENITLARHYPRKQLARMIDDDTAVLEEWQKIQKNPVFDRREIILACRHDGPHRAKIIGLYRKKGREGPLLDKKWERRGFISRELLDAMREQPDYDRRKLRYFYHLQPMRRYPALEGKVIEWSGRRWDQKADSQRRAVLR